MKDLESLHSRSYTSSVEINSNRYSGSILWWKWHSEFFQCIRL